MIENLSLILTNILKYTVTILVKNQLVLRNFALQPFLGYRSRWRTPPAAWTAIAMSGGDSSVPDEASADKKERQTQ